MDRDPRREEHRPLTGPSVEPREVWSLLERGDIRLLDLRTELERRRFGAPPGTVPVWLARHVLSPQGEGTIYLCQHAVRSKATLRNGAAEVAGGSSPGGAPGCQSKTSGEPTPTPLQEPATVSGLRRPGDPPTGGNSGAGRAPHSSIAHSRAPAQPRNPAMWRSQFAATSCSVAPES